jgi:hypothetical protein
MVVDPVAAWDAAQCKTLEPHYRPVTHSAAVPRSERYTLNSVHGLTLPPGINPG